MRIDRGFSRLLLAVVLTACSGAKTEKVSPQGLEELQKLLSATQDLSIVVSAGATKAQYEQRVTDALLKFGKPEDVCPHAAANFIRPEQKILAAQACQHLASAMDAYVLAKEYFGPKFDPITDLTLYEVSDKEYTEAKERFPMLEELMVAETADSGYKFYYRSAMLQALWKVAGQESETAKALIEKLNHI